MKKSIVLFFMVCCLMLNGCHSKSIGIIGGADGPTSIIVSERKGAPVKFSDIDIKFAERYVDERALPILDLHIENPFKADDRVLILDDSIENSAELTVYEYYQNQISGSYDNMKEKIIGEALLNATDNEEGNFKEGIYWEKVVLDEIEHVDTDDLEEISDGNKQSILNTLDELKIEQFAIVEAELIIKLNKKSLSMGPQVGDGEITRYYLLGKADNEFKIIEVYWEGFMND